MMELLPTEISAVPGMQAAALIIQIQNIDREDERIKGGQNVKK